MKAWILTLRSSVGMSPPLRMLVDDAEPTPPSCATTWRSGELDVEGNWRTAPPSRSGLAVPLRGRAALNTLLSQVKAGGGGL
jgi:hypothetical protein